MRKRMSDNWEQHIKSTLLNNVPNWDEEALWQEIESDLPKRKKRILGYWWFGILIIAVVGDTIISFDRSLLVSTITSQQSLGHKEVTVFQNKHVFNSLTSTHNPSALVSSKSNNQHIRTVPAYSTPIQLEENQAIRQPKPISKTLEPLSTIKLPLNGPKPLSSYLQNDLSLPTLTSPIKEVSHAPINVLSPIDPFHLPKGKITLETYTTVSYPWRSFHPKEAIDQNYLAEKTKLETPLEGLSMGILLGIPLKKNWTLKIGLERQQITERLNYSSVNIAPLSVESDSAYFYFNTANEKIYVPGILEGNVQNTRSIINYNTYKLYNAPILLGYEHHQKRLNWFFNAGISINLSQEFRGKLLNQNGELINTNEINETGYFKSTVGLSFLADFGLSYHFKQNLKFTLAMNHQYYNSSFTNVDKTGYRQRYSLSGLRLGVQYILD
ncbi:MAG: hypothetical protein AAFO07_20460 [Bacteroidota bacterium]